MIASLADLTRRAWGTILLSAFVGLFVGAVIGLSNDSIEAAVLDLYDRLFPVVTLEPPIITSLTDDEVVLLIGGEKHRYCEYRKPMQAAGKSIAGTPIELSADRIDKEESGVTRPLGRFPAGLWRVTRKGAASVQLYSTHVCNGRVISTLYADVRLP